MSFSAHATHRSLQNALDRMFPIDFAKSSVNALPDESPWRVNAVVTRPKFRYPTPEEIEELTKDIPKFHDPAKLIYDAARATVAELEGKNIPAADLTNEQKCALFTLAGFMEYRDGKMVSIRPVGISDNGRGGYILGIAPETKP